MRDIHQASVCLSLLGAEFNLMQGLLEEICIDTILFHILECLEEHIFRLLEIVNFDALNTNCERRLSSSVIKSDTWSELWRNLTLNNRLVEGGVGAREQQG